MGFLKSNPASDARGPQRLPSGSFTMDATGQVLSSTLPQTFPPAQVIELGRAVLGAFRNGREAQLPLSELVFHYAALKITAREMRGGAIVFISAKV